MVLDVCCFPLIRVILNLPFSSNPRRFRRKRNPLGKGAAGIVVKPLCILRLTNDAEVRRLALDVQFIAIYNQNRNVLADPDFRFFQIFLA